MNSALARTSAVVLAAGFGTRMKSTLPKVLHRSCGLPLVHYPVRAALEAGASEVIVVVGHGREHVESYLREAFGARVKFALQDKPCGTGDAARAALPALAADCERVLVFYGDAPLVGAADLAKIAEALDENPTSPLAMATCTLADPTGYGRVLRDATGHIVAIREQKDCTPEERAVTEINPGIYAARADFFREALASLTPNNAQGEYYLTDIVAFAPERGDRVIGVASSPDVMIGINDRQQLFEAEATMHERLLTKHRKAGVTIREGARIEDGVTLGTDVIVESGVVLRGKTSIGNGCQIDVGSVLTNVTVGENVRIKPYTVAEDAVIGRAAQIGPFSHLRPASVLGEESHVGNFVELKKTTLGNRSKANHLAYLGDGIVGEDVNVGAGTIFCNYDGFQKHTTILEDGVFIGSDSQLVAPVRVGKGAYVATATCVTKDVPAGALAIARTKQDNKDGYADRLKARFKAAKEAAKKALEAEEKGV